MRRVKLDRIDRQILRDLQQDGRTTNVELAKRAGISAPPCLRRVRALEAAKVIRGYHADIDAEVTNACRCSTYHRIRQAVHLAATKLSTQVGKL